MNSLNTNKYDIFHPNLYSEILNNYLSTSYGSILKKELCDLCDQNKLSSAKKQLILSIKAKEYYRFCIEGNAWTSVKYYLENLPELFKIHDLLLMTQPAQKFFYIINSKVEFEFEKILIYKKLNFNKHRHILEGDRSISIYTGFLINPDHYSLVENPIRIAFTLAEDAGIKIGFHYYMDNKKTNNFNSLWISSIRSFPIESNNVDDYSYASGGLRTDLNASFKSSWEANIARILNKQMVDWEYENSTTSYNTTIGYYIPDFKVIRDEHVHIIEVKGFWDHRSIEKVSSAINQVKDEKIIIIDSDFYSLINKKYKDIIPDWEHIEIGNLVYDLPVVGLTIGKRFNTIKNLNTTETLKLVREKDNIYDPNAIKVLDSSNNELGYIAKNWAAIFSFKMDCGFLYNVTLKSKELDKKRITIRLRTEPSSIDLLNKIGF